MNNIRQKGIEIELDKKRILIFDLNSFCELEERFGEISKAFVEIEKGSMKAIRTLLYLGLIHEDESLTEKEVGSMINLQNIGEISSRISKALGVSMPEASEKN